MGGEWSHCRSRMVSGREDAGRAGPEGVTMAVSKTRRQGLEPEGGGCAIARAGCWSAAPTT